MELTAENIFKIMETSNKYFLEKMKESLQFFVVENFSNIIKNDAFFNANTSIIEEFVNLQFKPEDIFQAVYEWSEYQATKKQQESIDEKFDKNDAIKTEIAPFLPKIQFKKMRQTFLNRYVVKRGFLFTYEELSEILDNANPVYNVTITNSKGESINGNLDSTTNAQTINVIKSLKNRESDNNDFNSVIYWKTKCKIPATPSSLIKKDNVKWYLIYFFDGDIGVRKATYCGDDNYLLAEMFCDKKFSFSTKCKIEIE